MKYFKDILLVVAIVVSILMYYNMNNNAENELKIRQQFDSYRQANFEKNKKWQIYTDSLCMKIDSLTANIIVNDSIIKHLKPTFEPQNKSDEELQTYFNDNYPTAD